MFSDSSWSSWRPPGSAGTTGEATAEREPEDILHEYVTRLNHVIARSRTGAVETCLQQLDNVPRPAIDDHAVANLLARKRRELLEQFNMLRHELSFLPDASLDAWLSFFFTAAELFGATHVAVIWHDPPDGWQLVSTVRPEEGPAFRQACRLRALTLGDVREMTCIGPDGRAMAALDASCQCLTLSAPPFLFEHAKQGLDEATGQAPLSCTIAYDRTRDIQEGMVLAVRLTVKNLTRDFIVLDGLESDHRYDTRERYARPSLGQLQYEDGLDCFTYKTVGQGVTPVPFETGVLGPGEDRTLELNMKFLDGGDCWRRFHLSYRRFSPDAFRQIAYVAVPGPATSFPPDVIYARLADVAAPEKADMATVILDPAAESQPGEMAWAYPFHVGKRAFSKSQACARFGEGGEAVHFSRWQQAWVLRTPSGCALVTQSRVTPYPRIQAECFILVDEVDQKVPIRLDESLVPAFKALPLGITEWESHPLGLAASLPKLRLTAFFHELERMGCSLSVTQTRLGRQCLWVEPGERP